MGYYYKIVAQVRDVKELHGDITYVVDNYEEVENCVVTTKWLYYATFFNNSRLDRDDTTIMINDVAYVKELSTDKYCMERICLDWVSSIIEDESSEYCGLSLREAYSRNGGAIPHQDDGSQLFLYKNMIGQDAYSILGPNANEIRLAAMQRYGAIQVDEINKGMGVIVDALKITLSEDGETEMARESLNPSSINVVGYIETEADKLLSTGVSMDKNSDEYKIVMQQLQNPVFYSVCGNFLE